MKTITFYSYKGGTGRSLALANAAVYLARLEFKVVALDFDLEAPGLNYKFSKKPGGEPLEPCRGVVDYIHQFVLSGDLPTSLKEFTIDISVPGTDKPLQLIPAGQSPSPQYWSYLAKLDWQKLFYVPNASGVQLMLDLKGRIEDELLPDFLLIDSRTGITEMGGVATTLLADTLICLVLPTLENLEGARAVLRSVRRSRRESELDEIDMTVALSRLPSTSGPEEEKEQIHRISNYFSEEADDLRDTITCSDVYVLHRESALETSESLRVGTGVSPDESILLRDYLRLFASVVPKNLIETKVNSLIQLAKEKLWEDPEVALKEVEELAESFGHPETYRALLHFYEVRNFRGIPALKKAQRLWEITRESNDSIVWKTLKRCFKDMPQMLKGDEWAPDLDFLEAVWREAGLRESEFGLKLAGMFEQRNNLSRAADVCLEMISTDSQTSLSAGILRRAIQWLDISHRSAEASPILRKLKQKFSKDPDFLQIWADHALRTENKGAMRELLEPLMFDSFRRTHPLLALRVYLKLDLTDAANEIADEALRLLGRGTYSADELDQIAESFRELNRLNDFLAAAKDRFPSYYIDPLLDRIRVRYPPREKS